jgi:hypothetical protein
MSNVAVALRLGVVMLACGCFSGTNPAASERTCEDNCDRQVRAGCATMAADFGVTCKQACLAYRATYPDCVALLNAMSGCVNDKVTFSCDASGSPTHDPVGICMNEEYDCYACTGDFAPCRN